MKALAPTADEEAARAFAAKSRGSPFWLEALVRSGGAETDAGRLVTVRLRGAGADAAALLALLAVAARPLTLADAATLVEWGTGKEPSKRRASSWRAASPSSRQACSGWRTI